MDGATAAVWSPNLYESTLARMPVAQATLGAIPGLELSDLTKKQLFAAVAAIVRVALQSHSALVTDWDAGRDCNFSTDFSSSPSCSWAGNGCSAKIAIG